MSSCSRLLQNSIGLIAFIAWISLALLPHTTLSQGDQITWVFDKEASAFAGSVSFLAAEITNGTCEEVHSINPDQMFTINPGFKLDILEKLGQQIPLHTPASSTNLSLIDALRIQYISIPQGPLPRLIDNSVSITSYFAKTSKQNNTVVIHRLIPPKRYKIGKSLSTRLDERGVALNIELFTTPEYDIANFLCAKEELNAYLTASDEQRRMMLDIGKQDLEKLESPYQKQGQIYPVEWIVSHFDMCNALISLCKIAHSPLFTFGTEYLKQICNDRRDWVYEGFKGGSELGVLAGAWLVTRRDGRLFAVTMGLNDIEEPLDIPRSSKLLELAIDNLSQMQ